MKKLFTLVLIFFIGFLGFSQNKKAVITFDKTVIDYGTIDKGANGVRDFVFTNTGDAPLIISNVKSTCGCTIPKNLENRFYLVNLTKFKLNTTQKELVLSESQ